MAIRVNATQGGFAITDGYLLITMIQMTSYLKPITVTDKVPQADGTILDVPRETTMAAKQYVARGQVYASEQIREENFGVGGINFAFSFEHVDGADPTQEAYAYVKLNGIPDWTLTGMVDV